MAIYTYFRVSTQSQVESNGIQMQKDIVDKYVNEHSLTIDGSFEDLGISGTILDRDGLTNLLSTIQKDDKILVTNTSRLWRDSMIGGIVKKQIVDVGADIISVEQPTYSVKMQDPNDFLINSIFEILDAYDKMLISIKLNKGRKAKAGKGQKACGTAPYGYKWNKNAELVVDYNNNLIVKDIFDKYIELGSLGKLKEYTISMGYKTRNGNDFSKQALSNILHNDFYIGYVTHGDIKVKGSHSPIIDEDVFKKANKVSEVA